MNPPLDLLAIGPHPDDVELFCGGTVIRSAQLGHRVAVLDLSAGELASNGTPEIRRAEAEAAAEVMGLAARENLGLPDGGIRPGDDDAQVTLLAAALRRLRPEMLLTPWVEARHPDHAAAGHLVRRALFFAGLKKAQIEGAPFRVPRVLSYQMRVRFTPSLLVDTSAAAERKAAAIACHASQVRPGEGAAKTLVASPRALAAIEDRDRYYGSMLGVSHAEPFLASQALGLTDPIRHFRDNPFDEAHAFEPSP